MLAAAMALGAIAACGAGRPAAPGPSSPEIRVAERTPGTGVSLVSVVGLPAGDLATLQDSRLSPDAWNAVLRVTAGAEPEPAGLPPVAGSHRVADEALEFEPAFPLDPAVRHWVVFDPARLPGPRGSVAEAWRSRPITRVIAVTRPPTAPSTRVTDLFPRDVLLENQLRVYIQFSGPMGTRGAPEHVRLMGEDGQPVEGAFLPLDVGLWDAERTRYTLLFDPGRVKRGILPNMELGRPLRAGRRYTLEVDRDWRDAGGRPLVETFRRPFRVVPAVLDPIVPASWRLELPGAGTRHPLRVVFPRPLDHALVERALWVTDAGGRTLAGAVQVDAASTRWTFTPNQVWAAGGHVLRALPELEDPAGNRVGRPFDFDPRQPARGGVDGRDAHAEARVPFTVRRP